MPRIYFLLIQLISLSALLLSVTSPLSAEPFERLRESVKETEEKGISITHSFSHEGRKHEVLVYPEYVPSSGWDAFWGAETVRASHSIWMAPAGILTYEGNDFCFVIRKKYGQGWVNQHSSCEYDFVLKRKAIEWCSDNIPQGELLKEVASFSARSTQEVALQFLFRCYLTLVAKAYNEEDLPEGFEAPIFFDWQ